MDVQTSFSLLFNWFKENDNFSLQKNFRQLNWKSLGEENQSLNDETAKMCLEIALQDMITEGFVKLHESGTGKLKNKTYVIVESMRNAPQTINISPQTAKNIKAVVNSLLPIIDLNINFDPNEKEIYEQDLHLLLEAISFLSKQLEESNNKLLQLKNKPPNESTGGE